jgi:8-oxo-dGTP pyrophosphatase MutT (NUDIX family)
MVRHIHDGRDYWTLPGGGIEEGETPEVAAEREVLEETGLVVSTDKFLFTTTSDKGIKSHCFLMSNPSNPLDISIGIDPEQEHLHPSKRMLQGVQWHNLDSMRSDLQVSRVIKYLNSGCAT